MKFVKLLFLSCLFSTSTWAQTPVINLELKSEQGPVQILVGDRLRRDGDTGALQLSGGVQIRQEDGSLLIADEVQAFTDISSEGISLQHLNQLTEVILKGRAFIKHSRLEIQADTLSLTQSLNFFSSAGGPTTVQFGDQILEADGGAIGDLALQIFYGFGGVRVQTSDFRLEGDHIQITLPQEGAQSTPMRILAEGQVKFEGQGVSIFADRVESGIDDQVLYLTGGVTIDNGTGALEAGSIQFDMDSQTFSLDSSPFLSESGQEFLSL